MSQEKERKKYIPLPEDEGRKRDEESQKDEIGIDDLENIINEAEERKKVKRKGGE